MSGQDDAQAELLRKFQAAVSGMELAQLHELAGDLTQIGAKVTRRTSRRDLRRSPFDEVKILRVRVDLDGAEPPIWRRLDLRSDLGLDLVHQVLQVAFDWTDSHLHRFSLGGHPFDQNAQLFLCPYDAEEGEFEDDGGIAASEVRLEETMQVAGDVLNYVYDYGDSWELTLRLEQVVPAAADAPTAVVVDGRRTAPPEDSGGGTDLASIARVVEDPAHFDLDELNRGLRAPRLHLGERRVDPRLVDLMNRLRHTPIGDEIAARTLALVDEHTRPTDDELSAALRAHLWFLDRASHGGIELTSAGYLKPADVEAASLVVPTMRDWIGKNNRESLAAPLLDFRQSLQTTGLLRKYKGALLLTRAANTARRDPRRLFDLLAAKLVPAAEGFDREATLVVLVYAATSAGQRIPLEPVAETLAHLGWQHRDGRPLDAYELYRLTAFDTLANVSDRRASHGDRRWVSPTAATLARAALCR